MADKGVADNVKDESGIIDNMAIAEPPLCIADASNKKTSKMDIWDLQKTSFCNQIPAIAI